MGSSLVSWGVSHTSNEIPTNSQLYATNYPLSCERNQFSFGQVSMLGIYIRISFNINVRDHESLEYT